MSEARGNIQVTTRLDDDIDRFLPFATDEQRAEIHEVYERIEPDPGCRRELNALAAWFSVTCWYCRAHLESVCIAYRPRNNISREFRWRLVCAACGEKLEYNDPTQRRIELVKDVKFDPETRRMIDPPEAITRILVQQ